MSNERIEAWGTDTFDWHFQSRITLDSPAGTNQCGQILQPFERLWVVTVGVEMEMLIEPKAAS
jgi:hypothetical protein